MASHGRNLRSRPQANADSLGASSLNELDELALNESEKAMAPTPKRTPASNRKRAASSTQTPKSTSKKTRMAKFWDDSDLLLQDEKSPIYEEKFNVMAILTHPKALEALPELKESFLSKSPEQKMRAIAAFKRDGAEGRRDPEWIRQAIEASISRAAGDFAEYEKMRFDEYWAEENPYLSDDEEISDSQESTDANVHGQRADEPDRKTHGNESMVNQDQMMRFDEALVSQIQTKYDEELIVDHAPKKIDDANTADLDDEFWKEGSDLELDDDIPSEPPQSDNDADQDQPQDDQDQKTQDDGRMVDQDRDKNGDEAVVAQVPKKNGDESMSDKDPLPDFVPDGSKDGEVENAPQSNGINGDGSHTTEIPNSNPSFNGSEEDVSGPPGIPSVVLPSLVYNSTYARAK